MPEIIMSHYAYWFVMILASIGLFGMLLKRNLIKKIIGMGILQLAVIMFWVSMASKPDGTVPVLDKNIEVTAANYINPLPHTLMLTAIVVGVATMGVAMALTIITYRRFNSLDEKKIIERSK